MTRRATVVDLFAGCGGGSIGFLQAGFEVIGAVEIDPEASAAYAANVGATPLIRDIREVTGEDLLAGTGVEAGELTLLFGCPPCQSFTILRRGAAETPVDSVRNSLQRCRGLGPGYGAGQPSLSARSTRAWNSSAASANCSYTGWTVTASAGLAATGTMNSRWTPPPRAVRNVQVAGPAG